MPGRPVQCWSAITTPLAEDLAEDLDDVREGRRQRGARVPREACRLESDGRRAAETHA